MLVSIGGFSKVGDWNINTLFKMAKGLCDRGVLIVSKLDNLKGLNFHVIHSPFGVSFDANNFIQSLPSLTNDRLFSFNTFANEKGKRMAFVKGAFEGN